MRTPVIASAFLLTLGGCSGDDLLLPGGAPAQIRVVSGDGQTARAGDPLLHPLVVEVLDGAGRPIPGAPVAFEFVDPPRGAEISAPATETDVAGRASAEVTLGNAAGDQPVVARLDQPGTDIQVQFLLTALERSDGGGAGPAPAPPPPPPGNGGGGDDDHKGKGKNEGKDKHDHGGKGKGKDKHDD
jgi:hypothetical protein